MKKLKALLLICLCAALVFAAFGCQGTNEQSEQQPVEEAAADSGSTAEEPIEDTSGEPIAEESEAVAGEGMTYIEVSQEKLDMIASGDVDVNALLTYDTSAYTNIDLSDLKIAVSLGYYREDSGQSIQKGYEETFAGLGITDVTYTQTEYDPVEQSEQIKALIAQKPDILYVLASDPNGITKALQEAMDAGIPTFVMERVNNVDVTQCICFDDYSAGYASMQALCEALGGEGEIAMCELDSNAVWNIRGIAAKDVLEQYPGIEVVATWSWDSTGVVTPRQAIDNFLTQFPEKGTLDGIWSAWDNATLEGIPACQEAGRTEILFASLDATPKAIEQLATNDQFVFTYSHCLYDIARTSILNGLAYLNGEEVNPKWCYTGYNLEKDKIVAANENLPDGVAISDFDRLFMADAWGIEQAQHFDYDYDSVA